MDAINRAHLLLQQRRYAEAESILKNVLHADPNDVYVLTLLSQAYLYQDKLEDAERVIDMALKLMPDNDYLYFTKARVLLQKEKYDEAEKHLQQAVSMDPTVADYHALWASIKMTRKQYEEALNLANKALEFEGDHLLGLNVRSSALLKLDRAEESYQTIEGALREDPNDPYTHSTYGWNLLENGDHKQALTHFREALKQDPNFEYAQAGMMEALKANNLFYRLFLKYAFWIGSLTEKYQWGAIIGFYFLYQIIASIAERNPALYPILNPILILMALIAFSTWVITPISNLFLRLNPYGKHLLQEHQIKSSNFVGISFLAFIAGLIAYFIFGDAHWISLAALGFAMMLPLSVMFAPSRGNVLKIYTLGMLAVGVLAVLNTAATGKLFNEFTTFFLLAFFVFQWVANFYAIRSDNA